MSVTTEFAITNGEWINRPKSCKIESKPHRISITTDPNTDLWQRTFYGFRNDNAPAYLMESKENFTFTVQVTFEYRKLFDQCGVLIVIDSNNWFKASIEFENQQFSRLGSVVTNNGYSDWATSDIELPTTFFYRLSRRGPDFLIESSADGVVYKQMRIFHLHALGATTEAMGQANAPVMAEQSIKFGVYACSPSDSSFEAIFENFKFEPTTWKPHDANEKK